MKIGKKLGKSSKWEEPDELDEEVNDRDVILRWKAYEGYKWSKDGNNMLEDENGDAIILDYDMYEFFKANYNNPEFFDLFYRRGISDLN